MTLKDVIRKGFDKIGDGNFKTASIIDKEGETITVIPIDQLNTIDERYLDAAFLGIGSSTLKPDRIRIRIDVLR